MDDIKEAIKHAIKEMAGEAARISSFDQEGSARLATGVANLVNSLSGITVIEDQELHNAALKAEGQAKAAGPMH